MNKKMTPRVIRLIAMQCLILVITISMVGFAVVKHSEYKNLQEGNIQTTTDSSGETDKVIDNTNTFAPGQSTTSANSTADSSTSSTDDDSQSTGSSASESSQDKSEAASSSSSTSSVSSANHPYAYAGFTPKTTDTSVAITRILVNGKYCLPENYKPTLAEAVPGSGQYLDYRVAPHYQEMYNAAKKDGITLTPISGYRSYQRQKNNFENRIANNMSAGLDRVEATKKAATVIMIPGASEHNAGLAMDICSLSDSFEHTKEFDWLDKHAVEYGFILRYPKDARSREITGVVYEPWHYRYVGVEAAKEIKARGITLEEYLGYA